MNDTAKPYVPDWSPGALTTYICPRECAEAIDWYTDVLGAKELGDRYVEPDGKVGHATLGIDGSILMLSDAFPDYGAVAPPPLNRTATFALSELLFGLFPACVMPFLVRRTGMQKAHHLALMTKPVGADEALACGIADAVGDDAEALLRAHLPRLTKLSGPAIGRYKRYMLELSDIVSRAKPMAVAANRAMFDDPAVRRNISRYVAEMKFPWEE